MGSFGLLFGENWENFFHLYICAMFYYKFNEEFQPKEASSDFACLVNGIILLVNLEGKKISTNKSLTLEQFQIERFKDKVVEYE